MCVHVLNSVLWCPLRFPHKNDVRFIFTTSCFQKGSFLMDVISFVCVFGCPTHFVLCFSFGYPVLPVSLDCQFLIAPSVFPNVYYSLRIPFDISLDRLFQSFHHIRNTCILYWTFFTSCLKWIMIINYEHQFEQYFWFYRNIKTKQSPFRNSLAIFIVKGCIKYTLPRTLVTHLLQ